MKERSSMHVTIDAPTKEKKQITELLRDAKTISDIIRVCDVFDMTVEMSVTPMAKRERKKVRK